MNVAKVFCVPGSFVVAATRCCTNRKCLKCRALHSSLFYGTGAAGAAGVASLLLKASQQQQQFIETVFSHGQSALSVAHQKKCLE